MRASSFKRIEATDGRSPEGNVQNLPLLCVEAICKFTPTSKLVRLYSTAVSLPGADWNFGLEVVLKKRLPFSLSKDLSRSQSDGTRIDALFDSSGAKVAAINHPEAFQFSSLCEFVESAVVPFRTMHTYAAAEPRLRFITSGRPLMSHLPNISKLSLIGIGNFMEPRPSKNSNDLDLLIPVLKKVLPQLEVFAVEKFHQHANMLDATLVEMLHEMAVLKQIDVDDITFDTLMRAATVGSNHSEVIRRALSRLTSMPLRYVSARKAPQVLSFLSVCCTQLTHLSVRVEGQFKPYLVALRALGSLNTLELNMNDYSTTAGISFAANECVRSVLDLRLAFNYSNRSSATEKVTIASLFPNVKTAALSFESFALEFCEKQVWPTLTMLTCFDAYWGEDVSSMAQFLACSKLPPIVDLSAVSKNLWRNSGRLTQIYEAIQSGPVKSLLLRGPLHREALARFQAHIDFYGENAKVTSWNDRDLGEQTSIAVSVPVTVFSKFTDFRIVGEKLNGENFTIRVVHPLAKKKDIFD